MGELHLEIYVERIRREYNVEVEVGPPKVNYREAPTQAGRVQHPAQEADRRLGPVRPHRRPARRAARRRRRRPSSSRRTSSAGGFPSSSSRPWRRAFARCCHKGPVAGYPVVGLAVYPGRRLLPRGGQFRPGVPDLRADGHARGVSQDAAGAAGAGDEDRDRVPQPVSGLGGGQSDLPPRHGRGHRGPTAPTPASRARCRWPRPSAIRPTCGA